MAETVAYKVLTADELAVLEGTSRFDGAPVDLADGYIHLSTAAQLAETIAKHFAGREADIQIVAIDLAALGGAVRWEPSRGSQLFPHVYAPITLDVVIAYSPLTHEPDGSIRLPVAG